MVPQIHLFLKTLFITLLLILGVLPSFTLAQEQLPSSYWGQVFGESSLLQNAKLLIKQGDNVCGESQIVEYQHTYWYQIDCRLGSETLPVSFSIQSKDKQWDIQERPAYVTGQSVQQLLTVLGTTPPNEEIHVQLFSLAIIGITTTPPVLDVKIEGNNFTSTTELFLENGSEQVPMDVKSHDQKTLIGIFRMENRPSGQYTLKARNTINTEWVTLPERFTWDVPITTYIDTTLKDTDNDGMSDSFEKEFGFNEYYPKDTLLDADKDGLSNIEEYQAKTNPKKADTDSDGISDKDEIIKTKTNPNQVDTDGGGLSDQEEIKKGTNPLQADTASLQGIVFWDKEQATKTTAQGVLISIQHIPSQKTYETITNQKGEYLFTTLLPGTYQVTIHNNVWIGTPYTTIIPQVLEETTTSAPSITITPSFVTKVFLNQYTMVFGIGILFFFVVVIFLIVRIIKKQNKHLLQLLQKHEDKQDGEEESKEEEKEVLRNTTKKESSIR